MKINGHEFIITPASLEDALDLQDAVFQAIHANKIKFNFLDDEENQKLIDVKDNSNKSKLENINIPSELVGDFFNTLLSLGMSKKLRSCLFECAKSSTFGKQREAVNRNFFEKHENRQYYFQVMIEVLKVNLTPFYKGLFSQYSDVLKALKNFLK